jgi:type I restriction enzyme S subunit
MTEQAAGLLGSSIIVPESYRFLHNQRLGLVKVNPDVEWNNEFFFHQFNTRAFRQVVHDSASGVKVRHTSPKKLGDVVVSFPRSGDEQRRVADRLNKLHAETKRLEVVYQYKMEELTALKQSLLQKAFAGELH